MKLKVLVLNVLLSLALASSGWASSKSMTVQVSCTIPAKIELASTSFARPASNTGSSVETQFASSKEMRERSGHLVQLYSLTAV